MEQRYQGLVCASCACVIERLDLAALHADVGVVMVAQAAIKRLLASTGAHTLVVADDSRHYTQACLFCGTIDFGYRGRVMAHFGHAGDGPMIRFESYTAAQEWACNAAGDFSYLSSGGNQLTHVKARGTSVAANQFVGSHADIEWRA